MLLLSTGMYAQITKNLGDFSNVRVFDQLTVLLVKANENKIVISGHDSEDVEIVNKGNDLKIRMKFTKMLQGDDISITLYYKNIDQIEASEGSFVSSQDTFKGIAFELNAKEGSQIKVNLDVDKLKAKVNSGAEIHVKGNAKNQDISITSGGKFFARDLTTAQTSVKISAGGEAEVFATDFVDAITTAGGIIDVYGSPKQVNQKNTAGGDINIRK